MMQDYERGYRDGLNCGYKEGNSHSETEWERYVGRMWSERFRKWRFRMRLKFFGYYRGVRYGPMRDVCRALAMIALRPVHCIRKRLFERKHPSVCAQIRAFADASHSACDRDAFTKIGDYVIDFMSGLPDCQIRRIYASEPVPANADSSCIYVSWGGLNEGSVLLVARMDRFELLFFVGSVEREHWYIVPAFPFWGGWYRYNENPISCNMRPCSKMADYLAEFVCGGREKN